MSPELSKAALKVIYANIEKALEALEKNDVRRATFALRRMLPEGYKHALASKAVAP